MNLMKLASCMRPAGHLVNPAVVVEMMKSAVGISLHGSCIMRKMLSRMFSLAVGRVSEPHGSRRIVAGGSVVPHIGPKASGFRLAVARRQHRNRCIVCMNFVGRQHMLAQRIHQGIEQFTGCANPVGQRGTIEIDSFPYINLGLPIERAVVGILGNQHMHD